MVNGVKRFFEIKNTPIKIFPESNALLTLSTSEIIAWFV